MNKQLLAGVVATLALGVFPLAAGENVAFDAKDAKLMPETPVAPPPCTWTGFYTGLHVGYGFGDVSLNELNEDDPVYHLDLAGVILGGQLGYNYQIGMIVLGVEGEFSWTDFDDRDDITQPQDEESKNGYVESDYRATLAGRIGLSLGNNRFLPYFKAGGAFMSFDYAVIDREFESGDTEEWHADKDQLVPMIGAGIEYAINCQWSVKVEYKHYFLENNDVKSLESDGEEIDARTYRVKNDLDSVEVGLNYRF